MGFFLNIFFIFERQLTKKKKKKSEKVMWLAYLNLLLIISTGLDYKKLEYIFPVTLIFFGLSSTNKPYSKVHN